jgi:hypothetical protein
MDRMHDEHAIQRLLTQYNRCLDDGRIEALVELFADDGRLKSMGKDAVGRAAIGAFFGLGSPRPAKVSGQHVLSNILIDWDGDEASAVSDFTYIRRSAAGASSIVLAGRYLDRFVRTPAGWRFSLREAVALARPDADPADARVSAPFRTDR